MFDGIFISTSQCDIKPITYKIFKSITPDTLLIVAIQSVSTGFTYPGVSVSEWGFDDLIVSN